MSRAVTGERKEGRGGEMFCQSKRKPHALGPNEWSHVAFKRTSVQTTHAPGLVGWGLAAGWMTPRVRVSVVFFRCPLRKLTVGETHTSDFFFFFFKWRKSENTALTESFELTGLCFLWKHLNVPQAQTKNPFLQSLSNSSLVGYGQYIFKAWCLVTNDNCKVKKQPNSKTRQHQQK